MGPVGDWASFKNPQLWERTPVLCTFPGTGLPRDYEALGCVHLWGTCLPWRLAPGLGVPSAGIVRHCSHMPSHQEARGVGTKNQTQKPHWPVGSSELGTVQHGPGLRLTQACRLQAHLTLWLPGLCGPVPSAGRLPALGRHRDFLLMCVREPLPDPAPRPAPPLPSPGGARSPGPRPLRPHVAAGGSCRRLGAGAALCPPHLPARPPHPQPQDCASRRARHMDLGAKVQEPQAQAARVSSLQEP